MNGCNQNLVKKTTNSTCAAQCNHDLDLLALKRAGVFLGILLVCGGLGCWPTMPDTTSTGEGNVKLDPTLYPGQRIQGEPNDTFVEQLVASAFDSV